MSDIDTAHHVSNAVVDGQAIDLPRSGRIGVIGVCIIIFVVGSSFWLRSYLDISVHSEQSAKMGVNAMLTETRARDAVRLNEYGYDAEKKVWSQPLTTAIATYLKTPERGTPCEAPPEKPGAVPSK